MEKIIRIKFNVITLIVFFCAAFAIAQTTSTELLYPNGAPDAKGDSDGDKPSITYFIPKEGRGDSKAEN